MPADPLADAPLRGATRSRAWRRVAHGLYVPGHVAGPGADLAAWQLLLPPGGAFTHLTAAEVWGWWMPPVPDDLPVLAAVQHAATRPKRPGIRTTRHRVAPPFVELDGLRVTTPAETLLACAADLAQLDLLVLVDAALAVGSCTPDEVRAAAHARRGSGTRSGARARPSPRLAQVAGRVVVHSRRHRSTPRSVGPAGRVLRTGRGLRSR